MCDGISSATSAMVLVPIDSGAFSSLAVLFISTLGYLFWLRKKGGQLPLPPGPPGLPILGNVLDIPSTEPWIAYKQWAEKYGDVFRVRLLNQDAIVINSLASAQVLMEQRSQKYSSRPYLAIIKMLGTEWSTGFAPYNDQWRLQRKVFQQPLRAEGVVMYRPMQLRRARELVNNIIEAPSEYENHFETFASSIIMSATYDYHPAPRNDPMVTNVQATVHTFVSLVTPKCSALFNAFPWLMHIPSWFPGASVQRTVSSFRAAVVWWLDGPFEYTRTKMLEGTLGPCMVGDALARIDENEANAPEMQKAVKEIAATSFLAASDTTASTLQVFVLAMTLYPEVQKRAQQEIKAVVGSDRLPDFNDRPNLPYVEAVLRETLRWHPVVPLSLPHCNVSDDTYRGYMIPQGTTIIPNVWAMTRDEIKYPDPSSFNPSRFFDDNGTLNNDTLSYTFGFGRRACMGRHFADGSLWSAIANLLVIFDFQGDGDGDKRVPRFTTGLTSKPEPFDVQILPRYDVEKLAALLEEE